MLRITEEGKDEDEYHYDFIKVEAGSFKRKVPVPPSETVTVNITKDYYIAATEFPQWLWIDVMHFNPSEFTNTYLLNTDLPKGESDFRPVERVSWEECNAFLQEFNKLTGLSMRLPTEAEWEYAARGGKYSRGYAYSGSNELGYVAWCQYNSNNVTHPCGLKISNELGLYDMHGNVWEYCLDFYEDWDSAAKVPSGDDPIGPEATDSPKSHVERGGDYRYSMDRYSNSDGFIGIHKNRCSGWQNVGFRPAI